MGKWSDLQQEPHLSTNPLSQRIIETFFDEAIGKTTDRESKMFFPEFCKMLSMFNYMGKSGSHPVGDHKIKRQKMHFLFCMYDKNHDNKISITEMTSILMLMTNPDPAVAVTNKKTRKIEKEELERYAKKAVQEMAANGSPNNESVCFSQFCKTLDDINLQEKMAI